ncbi:acetate--CoA ligase [Acetobacteraceae bacterium]|nr:acetate--CoA ligase [Acetobacteraceae bacterium]
MPSKIYPVLKSVKNNALIDAKVYEKWYQESIENPDHFWDKHGLIIDWFKPYTKVKNASFSRKVSIKWFEDGVTNVAWNCIDRHLSAHGDQVAFIWEGDNPYMDKKITYNELYEHVCRLSNVLKKHGVKKGDRVTIYMPMIPEAAYAMLACARIGAVHSVVFAGFSPEALAGRIVDCESHFVITCDESTRGGKVIPLKERLDTAIDLAAKQFIHVEKVLVVRRTGGKIRRAPGRDLWYHKEMQEVSAECPPVKMKAEDPLFILYTSGSTGKPKGVLHTTGGYLVYAAMTHKYVFDYHEGEIYWCTADIGWVTGHSYIVYGPLANCATSLIFEGTPVFPDKTRFWEVINKHKVNIFYTAPTALRTLMGTAENAKIKCPSLRVLGLVGEPTDAETWQWFYKDVGGGRCPIVDTWWQTETGGILITPLPGVTDLKPGSATRPFFGVKPVLVDHEGRVLEGEAEGNLCITESWPGQMRSLYGDHKRFVENYFSVYKGKYFTGDGCRRDKDGYYWITGRVDDVLNISGHRLGTAEIEAGLLSHAAVSEVAVVGYPHKIKGQGIYCYVTLMEDEIEDEDLRKALVRHLRQEIGPIATPDKIQFASGLPKTRSGKIMRRILRKIAEDDFESLGDISTLADPSVVEELIEKRQNRKEGSE